MAGGFVPNWWHRRGNKVLFIDCDLELGALALASNVASFKIRKITTKDDKHWRIEWRVVQSPTEYSSGVVLFTDEQLAVAFKLKPMKTSGHDHQLSNRYDGDRAIPGKFIGCEDYLNVPCPGTGQDGDPNISILVTEEMRKAVASLLI